MKKITHNRNLRRKRRTSSNIEGTAKCPRVTVFRSNRYLYLQAIDDGKRHTIEAVSSLRGKKNGHSTKKEMSLQVGQELGRRLVKKGIKKAVFDRGRYNYSGRVKEAVEGIRGSGLQI